ncbi:hypothetical protein F4808DRAFT_471683 [Astrocystis sublimbata]|nr:hypothetical protein F4808DRAFT_471683 [Astrocystis sublimbata]
MDPIATLGIVAAVCQFLQFSSGLMKETAGIYHRLEDKSDDHRALEGIYQTLEQVNSRLETGDPSDSYGVSLQKGELSLIAEGCKSDCARLISLLSKLKLGQSRSRLWASFRLALKEALAQHEIKKLKERIAERQSLMILQVVRLSRASVGAIDDKLEVLIAETQSCHLSLRQNASKLKTELTSVQSNISKLQSVQSRQLQPDTKLDEIALHLQDLSIRTKALVMLKKIIYSLDFEHNAARRDNIVDAHKRTFAWALKRRDRWPEGFSDESPPAGTGNILQWLESENDLFWISGKPGSGKSTLMKFIAGHNSTRSALSKWATPDCQVILASHYFWIAGTPIQKSLQGLWQSILYEFFTQRPQIIPIICPDRWTLDDDEAEKHPWTKQELCDCLRRLGDQSNLGVKFCAFIDGLDEYEGHHLEMAQTLSQLSRSPHLKLCVSSRPWNVFEELFGNCHTSKLYVHEWTKHDIREFSTSQLTTHPLCVSVGMQEGKSLIQKITERAEGVFLWVFLVTRTIREGLTNYERINDLHDMLDAMPSDLGQFFKHMSDSVNPVYHRKMARALRVASSSGQPLHFCIYHFLELELANADYALVEPVTPYDNETLARIQHTVHRHLNGHCMGLLEVKDQNVQFIHRTVRDWLRTKDIDEYLAAKVGDEFEAHTSIARATMALFKHTHFSDDTRVITHPDYFHWHGSLIEELRALLNRVNMAVIHGVDSNWVWSMVEETSSVVQIMFECDQARFGKPLPKSGRRGSDPQMVFRWALLESRVCIYLVRKLLAMPGYFDEMDVNPIWVLLGGNRANNPDRIPGKIFVQIPKTIPNKIRPCHVEQFFDWTRNPVPISAHGVDLIWILILRAYKIQDIFDPEERLDASKFAPFLSNLRTGLLTYLLNQPSGVDAKVRVSPKQIVPSWLAVFLLGMRSPATGPALHAWTITMRVVFTKSLDMECLSSEFSPARSVLEQICHMMHNFGDTGAKQEIIEKRETLYAFLSIVMGISDKCGCRGHVSRLLDKFEEPITQTSCGKHASKSTSVRKSKRIKQQCLQNAPTQ